MKRVRCFLLFLFSLTLFIMPLCVCVCVVRVHADVESSYTLLTGGECTKVLKTSYQSKGNNFYSTDIDVRAVIIYDTNSDGNVILMSESNFKANNYFSSSDVPSCSVPTNYVNNTYVKNNVTYYYLNNSNYNFGKLLALNPSQNECFITSYERDTSFNNILDQAYYYLFGDGAVDPVEPVTWGLVDIEGYQTNVAGSGNAAINNVDIISWNDTFDTLSNDITEGYVRIRYVPGHYKAVDKPNLLQQLYTDFILDVVIDDAEGLYPVTDGSASFRWGQVIQDLSIPFYSIYNLSNSAEGWIKRGWIYQVRLEIDDYVGEWQTVYASTSSGVENDMEIVNTTTITQNTINAIQQVNTINDTTNIWIIYETPVDPSPEYQPPEDDDEKPWWMYLLEMINNSIGVTNQYISEGTDESVQVVNNINNDNDTLNQTVNEYDDIEDDLITDFNDNTDNIDLDDTLIGNNGFLNAARWISEQFTTITTDNPFGAILKFSLVLGFVLIFLGRFR